MKLNIYGENSQVDTETTKNSKTDRQHTADDIRTKKQTNTVGNIRKRIQAKGYTMTHAISNLRTHT